MSNTHITRRLLPVLAFMALASSWANADPIRIRLFYAGESLTYLSRPEFSVRTPQDWISTQITPNPDGTFTMERPAPGAYRIHVVIDEDKSNPGDHPGDYNIFQDFKVTEEEPADLIVHMSKLIRMKGPWDNGKGIEGMLTAPIAQQPLLEMPRFAMKRQILFEWEPVVEGAEYRYTLSRAGASGVTQLFQKDTVTTSAIIELPPSGPNEGYQFNIFAKKNGQTVGTLFVHDAGAQGWALMFRVGKPSVTVWDLVGAVIFLLVAFIALRKFPRPATYILIGVLLASALGYFLYSKRSHQQVSSSASPKAATPQSAGVDRTLVEEFKRVVPLPAWWSEVEPELPIQNVSDLQSVWQSGGNMDEARGKRFYKSAFKALEEHPEVPHLVPFGLYLMSIVTADDNTHSALQTFWLDKFFLYQQRVDNCANCMVGDTTGEMVRDYANSVRDSNPAAGIAMIEKLLKERDKEISPYNWALTFETLAKNQWQMCDKNAAHASLEEGLRRFPKGWQADQLKKTLAEFQTAEPPNCNK